MQFYFHVLVELVNETLRRTRAVLPVNQVNRTRARYMPAVVVPVAFGAKVQNIPLVIGNGQSELVAHTHELLARDHGMMAVCCWADAAVIANFSYRHRACHQAIPLQSHTKSLRMRFLSTQ